MARSPKHSPQYVMNREAQLEVLDGLSHDEREFVTSAFNFGLALTLVRQYYGRLEEARTVLEQERQLLQVKRLGSIKLGLGLRRHET
jgi:aminopeptidase-like protein